MITDETVLLIYMLLMIEVYPPIQCQHIFIYIYVAHGRNTPHLNIKDAVM